LAAELGPVAAQSYRLASRIVNSIGAGHAVRSYAELDDSTLILISAPASRVPAIVDALTGSIECRGKTMLLCDCGVDSGGLSSSRSQGAAVGAIHMIPGFEGRRFVAEGDRDAMREAKILVRKTGGRLEEIRADKMGVYAAGLSFGTSLLTPLLEASVQCFLDAGMTKAAAVKIVDGLFQSSVRAYSYAGKRSWIGPIARADFAAVQREIDALTAGKPVLASHYRHALALALQLLGPSPPSGSKT
jgi:predicted short-subunit dehydrogenase-like oxidoreductase (DUF2520 family)